MAGGPRRIAAKNNPFRSADLIGLAAFTIGAEASHVIKVTVQLKDANARALLERGSVLAYLSDDANGDSLAASAPSSGWAIATNGLLIAQVTNKAAQFVSESNGIFDVNITEATAKSFYLILVMPDGSLLASAAITFAG